MAKIMTAAASFMSELMYISRDIVWKDQYTADMNETRDILKEAGQYMAAKNGDLRFTGILSFNMDILEQAGVPADIRLDCYYDKWLIPSQYRDACVKLQREFIIANYVEKNEYYRMLYGMPSVADEEAGNFLYNTKYPEISEPDIPIHELDIIDIYALEDKGYIDELLSANPDKKYLNHLGRRKIEPFIARSAERFSLLYMTQSEFVRINTDFRDTYAICRYAVTRSIYAGERRKDNEYYDNFMAMMILFMTIQQMFAKYLDADINRDFYDYESIKYVYDHYGVPFYPEIPLNYHIKIIKNINILLRYKGSTEVFYKLFDIFNFGAMEVYDYYLVKVQKMEGNKPVFVYNEDGTENVRAMYDIKFGEVELYNNPPLELSNPENIKSYSDLTAFDPYWDDDDEMLEKLYNMDYNYIESKYIGFSCVFDLMSITYESAVFFKLMFDTRDITETFLIYYGPASMNISMYDLIIYICALVCKRYGYDVALNKPALYLSSALGFNTKANMKIIRESVLNNPAINDDAELISLLTDMNINSAESIGLVFERVQSLRELLVQRKAFAKTTEEFHAYSQLEKTLMTSDYIKDGFLRNCKLEYDPQDPNTWYGFTELLGDINPSLATKVIDIGGNANDVDENGNSKLNVSTIDAEIQTALVTLRKIVTSLEYIEMCCSGGIEAMLNYLFKMLDFFKSAKAQLTGFNLAYTIGKDGSNAIKLFYEYEHGDLTIMVQKFIYTIFTYIQRLFLKMCPDKKYLTLIDFIQWDWSHTYIDDLMAILFRFKILKTIVHETRIELDLHDIIHRHMHEQMMKDKLLFDDDMKLIYEKLFCDIIEYYINDGFKDLTDKVIKCTTTYHYIERSDISFSEELEFNLDRIYKEEKLPIELEEYTRKYINQINVDASKMYLDYSPIDLDGNFNSLIGDLGHTLFRISDNLMKVSVTLAEKFKSHMYYMLRSFMRIHHIWARSDLYFGTSLRWLKSHVYLRQLLNIILDCHKMSTIETRVDYNIDFDSVVRYVNQKARFDDLLDMGDELELLYEYIEQYYYEYIVNDQFEELIDAIIGQRVELKELKKLTMKFVDVLQDWITGKHRGDIRYEFERRDIKNEYHDEERVLFDLDFRSLSIDQIEILAKSFCNLYFNHSNLFIENKEIIKNEITTLFKHYLVLYLYKNRDMILFADEITVVQDKLKAGFEDSIRYLVKNYLVQHFIKQEIKSDFDLWVIIEKINEGVTVKDALTLVADDTPKLLAERIYTEVIDYVINDRFDKFADALMGVTYDHLEYEKNFISYLTTLKTDMEHTLGYNKSAITSLIDETSRLYKTDIFDKTASGYNFDFSAVDLNGDPGVLLSTLGEELVKFYAQLNIINHELAEKIKGHISYATTLIDNGTVFILEGGIPMFLNENHASDRRMLYKQIFEYAVLVHKCTEILLEVKSSSMSYELEQGVITVDIKKLKAGFQLSSQLVSDMITDTLQFLIDDNIGRFVIKLIKSSYRYQTLEAGSMYYDDEILRIILEIMDESTIPMFLINKRLETKNDSTDTHILSDEINDIDMMYNFGRYVAALYTKITAMSFNYRGILLEKLDLLLSHIAAYIRYSENKKLTYEAEVEMINSEANNEARLMLFEEMSSLLTNIKKHGFDATMDTLIKLIVDESKYDDTALLFDEIENERYIYQTISNVLNSNGTNIMDAVNDIYYHYRDQVTISQDDIITKIMKMLNIDDRASLFDSDYLKDITLTYEALKFIINGEYGALSDNIHHVYDAIHHDKLNKMILTDRFYMDNRSDEILESVQSLYIAYMSNSTVNEIQEITQPLFLEYRSRVLNAMSRFIFDIKDGIENVNIKYRNIIKNDMSFIFSYIVHAYATWINSTMLLFDELIPYKDDISVDEINEYSIKLKRISNILTEQNFSSYMIDIMKKFISETYIKDKLLYGVQMDLISEELYFDAIEYLLNDQFEEFTDKLINCIYINRYINDSYATIQDWLHCDNTYLSFNSNASMTDEMKRHYIDEVVEGSLYLFLEKIGVSSNMIGTIDLIMPYKIGLKNIYETPTKVNNSFGFETELIVEYEQKVEN